MSFVQLLEDNWDDWITSCEQDNYAHHVVLHKATEHLSDLFDIKLNLNIQLIKGKPHVAKLLSLYNQ